MTDNEIVKAKQTLNLMCQDITNLTMLEALAMAINSFDEINRQKAEIEQWQGGYMTQKQEIANLEIELKAMRGAANSYKAEIERLQDNIRAEHSVIPDLIKQVRGKAIKEFAERLKENCKGVSICNYGYILDEIKKLVKEMVGDVG